MTTLDRIKQVSKQRGYSLTQVNEKANLGKNTIYSWKTKEPGLNNLKAVADVLGVSVDYLLGNTDEMHPKADTSKSKIDLSEVAEEDSWDEYVSSNGRPLSDHDKKLLRALFGE